MCRRATCQTCSRPTYAGCGMHIESVLGDVPKPERCSCREKQKQKQEQQAPEQPAGAP
jgi:hypothetical protein